MLIKLQTWVPSLHQVCAYGTQYVRLRVSVATLAPSGQIEGKFHKILKIPGISKFFQAVPNGFHLRRYRKFYQLLTHRNYRKNVDAAIVQVVILSGKIYRNV